MPQKILLIDDDATIRDSIGSLLQQEGYDVSCAADGAAAIEALEQGRYDLVISDIRMPGMNGLDLVDRIRQFAPDQKIIMITGFGSLETAVQAQHRGACDYLVKPFSLRELKESVHRLLRAGGNEPVSDGPCLDHKLRDLAGAFSLLSSFTKSLNSSLDLVDILDATVRLLNSIGETTASSLVLFSDRIRSVSGIRQGLPQTALSRGSGVSLDLIDAGPWPVEPMVVRVDEDAECVLHGPGRAVRTLVRQAMQARGFTTAYFHPVSINGEVIGVADVCLARYREFSETDRHFLATVLNEFSLAVARALSYLDMEERAREVGLLYQLSLTLSRSLTTTDSIRAICESATEITAARGALLQTTLEPGVFRQYRYSTTAGFSETTLHDMGLAFLPEMGKREPVISNDPPADGEQAAAFAALGIGRFASVPLIPEWENLGRLAVYGAADDRLFDERDVRLLTVFARHAAEVLVNASLYENIRRSREKVIAEKKALDAAIRALEDGVMMLDRDCRITQVSAPLAALTGLPEDRMVGRFCREVFGSDLCGSRNRPAPERIHARRRRLRFVDGRSVSVTMTCAPVRAQEGAVDGRVAVVREAERRTAPPAWRGAPARARARNVNAAH